MIEDKTWQPDMVESTRTSLYSLADALRRRPRRTTGQITSRAVRSDHDRLSPAKAMLSKPISKAKRRTGFLLIKRNVERAILNHGDAMLRFVEGDGTADARQNPPLHQLNHDRRRRKFIGAVERLRTASAQAGHASAGPIPDASTSGASDQGHTSQAHRVLADTAGDHTIHANVSPRALIINLSDPKWIGPI